MQGLLENQKEAHEKVNDCGTREGGWTETVAQRKHKKESERGQKNGSAIRSNERRARKGEEQGANDCFSHPSTTCTY